jgi:DNA-binding response OmpR family regulator
MVRILVVDDDAFSRRFLETTLEDAGWQVAAARDGEAGWDTWTAGRPPFDLVLCDVRMPRLNGYELIARIRDGDPAVPIIAVSSLGADEQVVLGLEAGADDYITKPVGAAVLQAKVRAALRRAEATLPDEPDGRVVVGELELDVGGGVVVRGGERIPLTRTELNLMVYLMRNAGRVISPTLILGTVWGEAYEEENEILRTAILRLRRKLERDPGTPRYLRTHAGLGYSLTGS